MLFNSFHCSSIYSLNSQHSLEEIFFRSKYLSLQQQPDCAFHLAGVMMHVANIMTQVAIPAMLKISKDVKRTLPENVHVSSKINSMQCKMSVSYFCCTCRKFGLAMC